MKLHLLTLLLLLQPSCLAAQELSGVWDGTLTANSARLPVVLRIAHPDGEYRATLDSPDQGVGGIAIDSLSVRDGSLFFRIAALEASFLGQLRADGSLSGTFTQFGRPFPLVLTRRRPPARPQTPHPPYPYHSFEVTFPSRSEGVTLAGTLTRPASQPPRAAILLVTGSGLQNRDEELFGHKPFLLLADYLTRRGIAVLRYDDRGFGTPDAELRRLSERATTADYALDALGAFDYLAAQPELRGVRCGILGHSEGGTIAFLAAEAEPSVSFVVSLAGAMIPGSRLSLHQNRRQMARQGLDAATVDACCRLLERCYATLRTVPQPDLPPRLPELKAALASGAEGQRVPEPLRRQLLRILDDAAASPWVHHFLTFDPSPALRAAGGRPVLAMNGTLDRQVDASENLGAIRRQLGNAPQVTVREYAGLNHLFQPCTTGEIAEYETIEQTLSPEVLADLAAWLLSLAP